MARILDEAPPVLPPARETTRKTAKPGVPDVAEELAAAVYDRVELQYAAALTKVLSLVKAAGADPAAWVGALTDPEAVGNVVATIVLNDVLPKSAALQDGQWLNLQPVLEQAEKGVAVAYSGQVDQVLESLRQFASARRDRTVTKALKKQTKILGQMAAGRRKVGEALIARHAADGLSVSLVREDLTTPEAVAKAASMRGMAASTDPETRRIGREWLSQRGLS